MLCLLGKLLVFEGKYEEAVQEAFGSNTLVNHIRVLLKPHDVTNANEEDEMLIKEQLAPKIIAVQTSFCMAIALEQVGKLPDALIPYSEVTELCRRLPFNSVLLRGRSTHYFVGLAMYRYGMLCANLTVDPRPLYGTSSQGSDSPFLLRSKLLFDAAVSLRMFLSFMPAAFGVRRHLAALQTYCEVLEQRFRRANYRTAFDFDVVRGQDAIQESEESHFCPSSTAEDLLFCSQLIDSISNPADPKDFIISGNSIIRQILGRLSRYGDHQGALAYCKNIFTKYPVDASMYGRLVLACAAAGRHVETVRVGEIYFNLGGKEPSIILSIARSCILFPSKAAFAAEILNANFDGCSEILKTPFRLMIGLACIRESVMKGITYENSKLLYEKAVTVLAEAVVSDETNPQTHFFLALAYALQRKMRAAEDSIKTSLSLESEQPAAWFLFALIASARKDHDLCLSICNSFAESHEQHSSFIPLSLLRSELFIYLGLHAEAARLVSSLIGSFTDPAGPVVEDVTSISAEKSDG